MGYIMWLLESVVFACSAWTASSTLSLNVDDDNFKPFDPGMPFFLGGTPEAQQVLDTPKSMKPGHIMGNRKKGIKVA